MKTIPLTLILTAAVYLGYRLGMNYLRGVRSAPGMIGAHLLLGVLALEQTAMLFAGSPNDGGPSESRYGEVTLYLFFATLLAGLIAALLRHRRREANVALASHVGAATAGVLAYLVWIFHL
jgi:hypothetical protein